MRKFMIAAAVLAATATPAAAQLTGQGGLVNVSVSNVDILKNFLNNDQIALLNGVQVPVTVAVPVGVAAASRPTTRCAPRATARRHSPIASPRRSSAGRRSNRQALRDGAADKARPERSGRVFRMQQ